MSEYAVTINVITYNQVNWIRECLDSILRQKTDFNFLVRIFDDCSMDGTTAVCQEYEKQYPDKVKFYPAEQNLGSKNGILINALRSYENIQTPYFVFIEGDDYLYSNDILQTEKDILDKHPECSFVYGQTLQLIENEFVGFPYPKLKEGVVSAQFVINHPDTYFFSNMLSRMVRTECLHIDMENPKYTLVDIQGFFSLLLQGNAYFCAKLFGIYRITYQGIATGMSFEKRCQTLLEELSLYSKATQDKFKYNLIFAFIEDCKFHFYSELICKNKKFLLAYYGRVVNIKDGTKVQKKKSLVKKIKHYFLPQVIIDFFNLPRNLSRFLKGKYKNGDI